MHLLVADDHPDSARSLAMLLRRQRGVESVDEARDGLQAVHLARQRMPDVAFLDVEMPGLTGADAASAIRLSARGQQRQPVIVAVSGNLESAESARACGVFSLVLSKPVGLPTLLQVIADAARPAAPAA